MTKSEAIKMLEAEESLRFCRYIVGKGEHRKWKDRKTGADRERKVMEHQVLVRNEGKEWTMKVCEELPIDADVDKARPPFKVLDQVVVVFGKLENDWGDQTAFGRLEKLTG